MLFVALGTAYWCYAHFVHSTYLFNPPNNEFDKLLQSTSLPWVWFFYKPTNWLINQFDNPDSIICIIYLIFIITYISLILLMARS